jgi:glycosyltransferase involved in cell wall biosynthesis
MLRKNVRGLLDALALQPGPETTLTVVGDGPQRPQLEQHARSLGIDDRVQFLGMLGRTAVRDALWNAHAFVLPSHHETFGVVLLEAMATGLPVIATTSGGPEDLVTPETGRLVPPGDTNALADALTTLREERASYDADAIRAYVRDQFGPAAFVRRTRTLYRRALHDS